MLGPAEQLLERLLTYHMNYGEKVELIQKALDQAQIEGAKKMQVAALNVTHEPFLVVDGEPTFGTEYGEGSADAYKAIRALSPEAVVKGEE